jgi:hypothetical protein
VETVRADCYLEVVAALEEGVVLSVVEHSLVLVVPAELVLLVLLAVIVGAVGVALLVLYVQLEQRTPILVKTVVTLCAGRAPRENSLGLEPLLALLVLRENLALLQEQPLVLYVLQGIFALQVPFQGLKTFVLRGIIAQKVPLLELKICAH